MLMGNEDEYTISGKEREWKASWDNAAVIEKERARLKRER